MSVFLMVYSPNKSPDSRYHRQNCPEAKGILPPDRKLGSAAQLKKWGYTPCMKCDPDNLAKEVAKLGRIAKDGQRRCGRTKGKPK